MAERELSDEEAQALGLPVEAPRERELSPDEVRQLGLKQEPPGMLRTAAVKVAEGATKGFLDELGGAVAKFTQPEIVYSVNHQGPKPSVYEVNRDVIRREGDQMRAAHPKLSFASNMVGDAASDYLLSRAGVPVASLPGQMTLGAVSGAGYADENTPGGKVGGAAIGAGAGGVGYGLGKYVVPKVLNTVSQPVKRGLQNFAARRAVKASGAIQSNIRGIPEEKLLETGRILLDQGVVKPFRSPAGVKAAADEALERLGPAVGETLRRADASAAPVAVGPGVTRLGRTPGFDWEPVRKRLTQMSTDLNPVDRRAAANALRYLDDIEEAAVSGGGYSAANDLKTSIQNGINWRNEPNTTGKVARQIQNVLKDEVDSQLEKALGPQVGEEFVNAKKLYGAMSNAAEWGKRGTERELGNRFVSPSDYGAGMASLAGSSGGLAALPQAAALALVHKLVRGRGASAMASGANALAKANLPRRIAEAQKNPAITAAEGALLRQWLAKQDEPEKPKANGPLSDLSPEDRELLIRWATKGEK